MKILIGYDGSACADAAIDDLRKGDPKRVLVKEAEAWEADCIFVGARGLTHVKRFFSLGSFLALCQFLIKGICKSGEYAALPGRILHQGWWPGFGFFDAATPIAACFVMPLVIEEISRLWRLSPNLHLVMR
jgi:hypothetical protein